MIFSMYLIFSNIEYFFEEEEVMFTVHVIAALSFLYISTSKGRRRSTGHLIGYNVLGEGGRRAGVMDCCLSSAPIVLALHVCSPRGCVIFPFRVPVRVSCQLIQSSVFFFSFFTLHFICTKLVKDSGHFSDK